MSFAPTMRRSSGSSFGAASIVKFSGSLPEMTIMMCWSRSNPGCF